MPKQTNGRVVPETGKIEYIYDDMLVTGGDGGSQTNDDPYGDSCCVSNIPGPPGKNAFENIDKDINFNNYKIINLGDATDPQDGMNLISTERLLNNFLFGDVIGDLYSPKTVVGLHGRPITDEPPFDKAVLIWDESAQMWIYGKGGGGSGSIFEVEQVVPYTQMYEIGEDATNPIFNITYKGLPIKATLVDSVNHIEQDLADPFQTVSSDYSFYYEEHGKSVTFVVRAEDEYETVSLAGTFIEWGTYTYWGSYEDSTDYESMLTKFNDQHQLMLLVEPDIDINVEINTNEYFYFFQRADYSSYYDSPTFTAFSITGGVTEHDEFTHTNQFGIPVKYKVYRSDQKNLGVIDFKVRNKILWR